MSLIHSGGSRGLGARPLAPGCMAESEWDSRGTAGSSAVPAAPELTEHLSHFERQSWALSV